MAVLLVCKLCGVEFSGRRDRKYCCDHHRWQDNAKRTNPLKRLPKTEPKPEPVKQKRDPENPEVPVRGKLSGAGARRKGARGENEVCKILTAIVGTKHVRNLDQTREGGGDVQWGPFLLEVKTTETVSMPAWQRQAVASAEKGGDVPAVVWRQRGAKWWIALPFEEFATMFETLRNGAEQAQLRIRELEQILYGAPQ